MDIWKRQPIDTPTAIGIGVVIGSNVVISLALNFQKLAHRRLNLEQQQQRQKQQNGSGGRGKGPASQPRLSRSRASSTASSYGGRGTSPARYLPSTAVILETEPLLQRPPLRQALSGLPASSSATGSDIGDRRQHVAQGVAAILPRPRASSLHSGSGSRRLVPKVKLAPKTQSAVSTSPGDAGLVAGPLESASPPQSFTRDARAAPSPRQEERSDESSDSEDGNESDYLKSKLWWLGFALMNVGEFGNFLSYAYAPASVVAPLGASALIANCFFAPLILHEKFRKRDLLGIALTILGAVTVISAAKTSDLRLDPDGLLAAIKQRVFLIYSVICVACVAILIGLSKRSHGNDWIVIDIGICALFGGYTVLSTKAISTLISMLGFSIFKYWITYPTIVVLLFTGLGQIRYLNRALMRFDSKAVIPSQFVGFNLAAIVGSAILYRDFENVKFHQFLSFANGVAMTFLGVWILATRASVVTLEEDEEGYEAGNNVDVEAGRAESLPRTTIATAVPIALRKKASTAALGLSPGQHLLIAADARIRLHETGNNTGSVSARRRTIAL